jgi:hypothetical protein
MLINVVGLVWVAKQYRVVDGCAQDFVVLAFASRLLGIEYCGMAAAQFSAAPSLCKFADLLNLPSYPRARRRPETSRQEQNRRHA